MTQRAAEYYRNLATRHELRLPALLASDQSSVWQVSPISLHVMSGTGGSDQARRNELQIGFYNALRPCLDFSSAVARKENPDVQGVVPHSGWAASVLQYLRPGKLRTGQLYDFRIEALAPDEVPDDERERLDDARTRRVYRPSESGEEVYFLTTAALRAGSRRGRVACIGLVYMPCERDGSGAVTALPLTPRVLGVQVPSNVLWGRSVLEDSRAIATIVELHSANQPPFPGSFESGQ
jgi:hypothetical protein